MKQNKTANEVAQRFGLTYAPMRVQMLKKTQRRMSDLGKGSTQEDDVVSFVDDPIKLSLVVCTFIAFFGAICIVVAGLYIASRVLQLFYGLL